MSQRVLDFIKTIPLGGGYTWDVKVPTSGCPKSIIYKDEVILQKDSATYCCGLTFYTWFELYGQYIDIAVSEMKKVQQLWYCARGNRPGCQDALHAVGQGSHVNESDAESGDYLQFWRTSGSGHSVVYISHDHETLHYWSTQPKTNGVGYRSEPLAKMEELYFVRPLEPQTVIV